ncbi:hypothetical protein BDY24DRAFT_405138 [Mrakia frigida]|uniref:uncharacterized protein n=1 Tax=Mrakia frigida TaxID=29902 RepID=UPI003FCC25C4
MVSTFLLPFVALASLASAQLTINTPGSVVQCQPTLLTYSGGRPPYYLSILPGQSLANPYESIFPTNDLSYSWLCDLGANTTVTFGIKDSDGVINYTGVLVVGASPSNNASCIGINAVVEASVALTRTFTPTPAGATSATATGAAASGTDAAATSAAASAAATTAAAGGARSEMVAGSKGALALSALVVLGGAALVGL